MSKDGRLPNTGLFLTMVYDYARKADQARDIEIQNENWG